ncbi:hypothetical protein [Nonomuraea basaltis]|uniref:hypothetical protein n=1 Tax=Nonomuraea basaltis TaxID=2495887 RepID=UPI00110C5179|nr:hypothetical protein [Nonomuraea basaltis]TMR93588.1 hypothetical protein EJK15_38480 [Nonomuraea basaltis]
MSLSSIGLTEFEGYTCRPLLNDPDGEVHGDPDVVEVALARLMQLELIHRDEDGRVVTVDPEVGIARLIRRRFSEANAELRRISRAWEALHTLTDGGGAGSADGVERIDGGGRVNERI